jgi:anti-anti-sigma factor
MTHFQLEPIPSTRAFGKPTAARSSAFCPRIEISTQWPNFDVALVTVEGEVDAAGHAELLDHALSKAPLCRLLILDLERVSFLSCSGYDMLRTLERRCAMADVELSVLYGASARRMVEVCERAHRKAS